MNGFLILEEPNVSSITLLEDNSSYGVPSVRFEAVLQTFGVPNRNKRIYTEETGNVILNQIQKLIKERKAICEIDHPIGDSQERQTKVLLSNAAFMIENAYLNGNQLIGECKTLSTTAGRNLAALIKDGVNVGFSLRALGFNVEEQKGFAIVKPPVMYISYDAVTIPSHEGADIVKLKEDQVKKALCNGSVCHLEAFKESLEIIKTNLVPLDNILKKNQKNNYSGDFDITEEELELKVEKLLDIL